MQFDASAVAVNHSQCRALGIRLAQTRLSDSFYKREYLSLKAPAEILLRMHFFAVAICHQTHALYSEKHNLWGWDYLEHGFVSLAKEDSPLLNPEWILKTDNKLVQEKLAGVFSDENKAESSRLDRLEERVQLMREAAARLIHEYKGQLSVLLETSGGWLEGEGSIYRQLDAFEAFKDPRRKKTVFFLKLITEAGLFDVNDPQHYIPIMDYHMQRVLLRSGCVEIPDRKLRKALVHRQTLESDEPVRGACIEALRIIASFGPHPITRMNDFFWTIGRSCCHEKTLCRSGTCEKSPCSFALIAETADHSQCLFQDLCPGAHDDHFLSLWQPVVKTHYY